MAERRSDARYPSDDRLVELMREHGSYTKLAAAVGVRRESLRDFVAIRPALKTRLDHHGWKPMSREDATASTRRSQRESMRRKRANDPEGTRRARREQMAKYGPEYRQRWNHYNRLRRKGIATPTAEANEYALILRGDPCCYCGAPTEHIDHIEPIAHGGSGDWDNLTAACAACNFSKSDRSLLTFLLTRRTT